MLFLLNSPLSRRLIARLWHTSALALLATALLSGPVRAAPPLLLGEESQQVSLMPALEVLLDTGGGLTLEQIDSRGDLPFVPALANKRYHLENGSLWIRFDAAIRDPAVRWRLILPLPGIDRATLHFRDAGGRWVSQNAGDTLPMAQWAQPGRYPIFSLAHETGEPVRYYLQIRHPRIPYSAMPRIVNDVQLVHTSQSEHMLLGIYFGLAALVVAVALVNAMLYRDTGFGTYAAYIGVFAASQAAFTGVAGLYWWPGWADANLATMLLLPLAAATAMLFVRTVTLPRRFSPLLDRVILGFIVVLPLAGMVDGFLRTNWSYAMMNGLIGCIIIVMLTTVGFALRTGDHNTRWLAAGFLPVLVCAMFPLLRNLNLIASSYLSDYALMLGSVIEVPVLFYGLQRRVSQRRDLSVRTAGLTSRDPLTGLDSSDVFLGKLRQSMATAERYQLPFAVLVVNLANHGALQKSHGRETGDRAIVMAASRIRGVAHSTDPVARIGNTEFAMLMEGPLSAAAATDVATRILASGLRPSNQLPDAEPLQFHIAVGHLEGKASVAAEQAAVCMARLQQAARALNDGSRKAIRAVKL